MQLEPGTTLGHYEVLSSLGAGGMGEVYRAKDTKLGREVAIKLLLEEVSADPERMARFEREARVLASLNHPNIASLHAFERDGDTSFLVMEVVEGETLADRIRRGAIPINEALPLFLQIAEGLEAAHEKGVIHRDLKPANIKVTDSEQVKILDFGLAKAMLTEDVMGDPNESPTLTAAATRKGQIMGTAAYMSPEQSIGAAVDQQTDIWAFGAVFFEALAGQPLFTGETTSHILAEILKSDPDWDALPKETPSAIRRLLRRCLARSPRARLPHIGGARLVLEDAASSPPEDLDRTQVWRTRSRPLLTVVLAVGVALGLLAGWLAWRGRSPAARESQTVRRLSVNLPTDQPLHRRMVVIADRNMALSPDGKTVIYVTPDGGTGLGSDGRSVLIRRRLGSLDTEVLRDTQGASEPFFSPDGQWLGFSVPGVGLKKIRLSGGSSQLLCPLDSPLVLGGGAWSEDGFIYFTDGQLGGAAVLSTLMRVREDGGVPEAVLPTDGPNQDWWVGYPATLPGGRALLLTVFTGLGIDNAQVEVLNLTTRERLVLDRRARQPSFTGEGSSPQGYVVYAQPGKLMALPFDAERLVVSGPNIEVTEGNMLAAGEIATHWSLSGNGTLVYAPSGDRAVTLVGRGGASQVLTAAPTPHAHTNLSISPDGRQIAIRGVDNDIWIYDLERKSSFRLTSDPAEDSLPMWSRDGQHVLFASMRGGKREVFRRQADGTGRVEKLGASDFNLNPFSLTPDQATLLTNEWGNPRTQNDILLLALDGSGSLEPLFQTEFNEDYPILSPDGRWLAYQSDESGRAEIYVQPFPALSRRWIISTNGGDSPAWDGTGEELFYRSAMGIESVTVETDPEFRAALPRRLFEGSYSGYAVLPNGEQFVLVKSSVNNELIVVENWFEELKRRVPTD